MTGEAYGKLKIKDVKVFLVENDRRKEIPSNVYIHVKGFALARVTHLDIEAKNIEKLIRKEKGDFLSIYGIENGLKIKLNEKTFLEIIHPLMNKILKNNEKTRTWVGKKEDGIYIGFRKEEVRKLEKIAKEDFGFKIQK